jgi:hypothetical protein
MQLNTRSKSIVALIIAALMVCGIDIVTNEDIPAHDAVLYIDMAREGILGNQHLAAPYAFRPAVPLLVGVTSSVFSLPVEEAFRITTRLSGVFLLWCVFLFSTDFGVGFGRAAAIMAIVGFSFFHVKYPLFAYAMVDIEAYIVMVAACWLVFKGHPRLSLAVSCIGVFFKEFLVIPSVLVFAAAVHEYMIRPSKSRLVWVFLIPVIVSTLFLLPRLYLPISVAYGNSLKWVIPPNGVPFSYLRELRLFLSNPVDCPRQVNVLFSLVSYFLPTLFLLTPKRASVLWRDLGDRRYFIVLAFLLVVLFTMVGGSNIMIFVSYAIAVQVILLAYLFRQHIPFGEVILVLFVVAMYNKIVFPVPSFVTDFGPAVDFYGGWASRVNGHTVERFLQMAAVLLVVNGARWMRIVWKRTA